MDERTSTGENLETFRWRGFDLPVHLIRLTGAGPESLEDIAASHIALVDSLIGYRRDSHVVEIGCGIGRDAIPLTGRIGPEGSYLGIDIIGPSIAWCTENISARFPHFRFLHYDVADQLHNPNGTLPVATCRIPVADRSIDIVIAFSVFTHMFEDGIGQYLREIRRVLKPAGRAYATCFLVDDATLLSVRDRPATGYHLSFRHGHGVGCYINDPAHPLGAVAYRPAALLGMARRAGLALARPPELGRWQAGGGQDAIILRTGGASAFFRSILRSSRA